MTVFESFMVFCSLIVGLCGMLVLWLSYRFSRRVK